MGRKEDDRHGKWICNYDYRSLETIAKWETVAKPQVISGGKRNDKKKKNEWRFDGELHWHGSCS